MAYLVSVDSIAVVAVNSYVANGNEDVSVNFSEDKEMPSIP